jgi:hypothetical protein
MHPKPAHISSEQQQDSTISTRHDGRNHTSCMQEPLLVSKPAFLLQCAAKGEACSTGGWQQYVTGHVPLMLAAFTALQPF